jgi:hypothetical protein
MKIVMTFLILSCISTASVATVLPQPSLCHHMEGVGTAEPYMAHFPCTSNHTTATLPVSTAIPNGMPSLGTTKATIHSQFPVVILYNFTNSAVINTTITNAADIYLARLSRQYYIETNGNVAPLLKVAAQRLTANNLLRLQSAFGKANVDAAVKAYATATTQAGYAAGGTKPVIARSQAKMIQAGITGVTPSPNLDMTLYEIYLDYLTSGLSVEASLAMGAGYASAYLGAAFEIGYEIGGAVYFLDDQIDPEINVWIGEEEGAIVSDVVDYVSSPDNFPAYDAGVLYDWQATFDDYTWNVDQP